MKTENLQNLDPNVQKNVNLWLEGAYDEETKVSIRKLLEENPTEIIDAFYTNLDFGTGGLRGIMGVGSNRMNVYTVRAATQGLANYLNQLPKKLEGLSVFIGFDSRIHSREFAEEAAKVLAGNGIKVYIFNELRPVPLVSFGCRYNHCNAGIMVTASHNPPQYNGYKVYWDDGAQVLPPHDTGIIAEVQKITDPSLVKKVETLQHPLIKIVYDEVDLAYLEAIKKIQIRPVESKKDGAALKIVYTSLHGAGITIVPKALFEAGFSNLFFVDNQITPDGTFPTVKSPNPEEKSALKLGIDRVQTLNADLLIATDPDTDRVGIAVKHAGQIQLLTGNQVAVVCLHFILEALTHAGKLPPNAAFIKTIATTELFKAICQSYNKTCFDVLTGFKYIAEKIREWENDPAHPYTYIFGGEESYGYLLGTLVRDKDGVSSSVLIAETALYAKLQNKTLVDLLYDIYKKYGFYHEKLVSINFGETKEGKEKMRAAMERFQKEPPHEFAGIKVKTLENYEQSISLDLDTGNTKPLLLPKSNAFLFWLEDGSKLLIRPSGTEPKIKLYCGVIINQFSAIDEAQIEAEKKAKTLIDALNTDMTR